MKEIKALTALRGLFALWVLSYHLVVLAAPPGVHPHNFWAKGYLGVDFFFLLSGFVLAGAYGQKFTPWPSLPRYLNFLICRAGRMYPLHIVVTAVCVFVAWKFGKPYSPYQVVTETALIHRWPFVPAIFQAINGPAWSISTEIFANILMPLFVLATLVAPRLIAGALGIAAGVGITMLGWSNHGSLDLTLSNTLAPVTRCICEFGIGMLLYRWRMAPIHTDWAVALFAVIGGIALGLQAPDPMIVASMCPIILAISGNRGRVGRTLSIKPLHLLGELSFSIYLVHLPIIVAVEHVLGGNEVAIVAVVLATTMTISALSYRFIEVPWRDRSKAYAAHVLAAPAHSLIAS